MTAIERSSVHYPYWSGRPRHDVELYLRDGAAFGVVPTNDRVSTVVLAWRHQRVHEFRYDIEGHFIEGGNR